MIPLAHVILTGSLLGASLLFYERGELWHSTWFALLFAAVFVHWFKLWCLPCLKRLFSLRERG